MELNEDEESNCRIISVGDILILEEYRCKVVSTIFVLNDRLRKYKEGDEPSMYDTSGATDYNSELIVYVERIGE